MDISSALKAQQAQVYEMMVKTRAAAVAVKRKAAEMSLSGEQGRWEMVEAELERVSHLILLCGMDEPHYQARDKKRPTMEDWWRAPPHTAAVEIPSLRSSLAGDDDIRAASEIESYNEHVAVAQMDSAVVAAVKRAFERQSERQSVRQSERQSERLRKRRPSAGAIIGGAALCAASLRQAIDELPEPAAEEEVTCGFGILGGIVGVVGRRRRQLME